MCRPVAGSNPSGQMRTHAPDARSSGTARGHEDGLTEGDRGVGHATTVQRHGGEARRRLRRWTGGQRRGRELASIPIDLRGHEHGSRSSRPPASPSRRALPRHLPAGHVARACVQDTPVDARFWSSARRCATSAAPDAPVRFCPTRSCSTDSTPIRTKSRARLANAPFCHAWAWLV